MKQDEAENLLKMGHNIFLTGSAGSGKTFLLNKYIQYLKDNNINVGITASTGLAASHLNGRTIHSWCGMNIAKSIADVDMKRLMKKQDLEYRVRSAKVLIIDEISMLSANRLDIVNHICQAFRQDIRPFGNLQVVLCGDFFQLPPVVKESTDDDRFVVESDVWQKMNLKICYLTEQHRHGDKKFLEVLDNIRAARNKEATYASLKKRINVLPKVKIRPTKLYPLKIDVSGENDAELRKLPGDPEVFTMTAQGPDNLVKSLKEGYCLAPEVLQLKKDAVVMFVKNNFNHGYVNGTLGQVIGFDEPSGGMPVVKTLQGEEIIAYRENWGIEEKDEVIAQVNQVPLRLAWAITIHKSQGMTLDCAEINLGKSFAPGMGYVALSRVRSFDTMKLIDVSKQAIWINEDVIELDKDLKKRSFNDLKELNKLKQKEINEVQQKFVEENKSPAPEIDEEEIDVEVEEDEFLDIPF